MYRRDKVSYVLLFLPSFRQVFSFMVILKNHLLFLCAIIGLHFFVFDALEATNVFRVSAVALQIFITLFGMFVLFVPLFALPKCDAVAQPTSVLCGSFTREEYTHLIGI